MKILEEFKIEAVVKFNNGEAWVLNRKPEIVYEKKGNIMYGNDYGFYNVYGFEAPCGKWKAFAGHEFDLPLKDGNVEHCYGQWWNAGHSKVEKILDIQLRPVTFKTNEDLIKCYVFTGASIEENYANKLRSEYSGCVYPYRDYEKIIKFDPQRKDFYKRLLKLERDKKSLIKEIKKVTKQL